MDDLAREAELDVAGRYRVAELPLEQLHELPPAHLYGGVVDALVRVAASQGFVEVDAHHVGAVLAVADLEDADARAVEGYGLVAQPDRRLDVLVGQGLVGRLAGKVILEHAVFLLATTRVEVDADNDVTAALDRRIGQRDHVAQECPHAVVAVGMTAKLDPGIRSRSTGNFHKMVHVSGHFCPIMFNRTRPNRHF